MAISRKNKKSIILIIFFLLILISVFQIVKYSNGVLIVQLPNTTTSQMMGYVLKTKNNKVIVVDGGTVGDAEQLKQAVNEYGGKIDAWFITHPHKDHIGAFTELVKDDSILIDKIYISLNTKEWYIEHEPSRENEFINFFETLNQKNVENKLVNVSLNQIIQIDNLKIQILGVANPEITLNSGNNSSMVFKINVNNKSILFLGDTGAESSAKLISLNKNNLKSYAVQVSHHGQQGATQELYNIISPKICFWPTPDWLWINDSGEGEDSGPWKTKETRSWFDNFNKSKNYVAKDGKSSFYLW